MLEQACRLAASPLRGVLILEGTARDLAPSGMRREAVQGALIAVTVLLGIPLLRARSPEETARLMLYAARQIGRTAKGTLPRRFGGKRPRGKRRVQLHVLQGIPGVGPSRARGLLDTFGSLEAVVQASFDELVAVPGIGYTTARAVRWTVREPAPSSLR